MHLDTDTASDLAPVEPNSVARMQEVSSVAGQPLLVPGQPQRRLAVPEWAATLLSSRLALVGCCILLALVLVGIFAPLIAPYAPQASVAEPSLPPSWAHLFGTTTNGEDLFSQIVWGTRTALFVGICASLLTTTIGVALGMTAGYLGGLIGELLNLLMNIFMVIPYFALLIVISSLITTKSVLTTIVVIAIVGWAGHARLMQSQTLSVRNRDFVNAAIVAGVPTWRIILIEIMPNMISLIAHGVVGAYVGALVADAGLALIGLGNPNATSWGMTLFWAQSTGALLNGRWWHFVFPGLALALACTALIFINYGIDVISNPQLRQVKIPKHTRPGDPATPVRRVS